MLEFLTSCLISAGRNPNTVTIGHPSYRHTLHCASTAPYYRTLTGLNVLGSKAFVLILPYEYLKANCKVFFPSM